MSVLRRPHEPARAPRAPLPAPARLPAWWPLALVLALAAALRLSTLDLQSFWYDEAFTPVHVLHPSLLATLRSVVHSENTPPLWYVLAWADTRLFGDGEIALRAPSALAGIATVALAWAIGRELSGRAGAIACALFVAVNPLFVWYSQEARAYALFVFTAALALFFFLRLERACGRGERVRGELVAFVVSGALALASHYFAVFLLIPMVLWLLWRERSRRAGLIAGSALALAGAALVPLISAQGGHGTQWIGRWPLGQRLQAIPQYYLTGYSGAPLGHGIELLVALPILAALALGLWCMSEPPPAAPRGPSGPRASTGAPELSRLALVLAVCACGVLIPIALVALGADYLAPRNLVAAMIPLTALIAAVSVWPGAGKRRLAPIRVALIGAIALAFLAVSVDVDLSPRLQRGNWRGLADELSHAPAARVVTTVELGTTPLEYYVHGLHQLHRGAVVRVREIDETGYAPLRAGAARPPAPGFHLLARLDVDGLIAYRFVSPVARPVSEATLRRDVITPDAPPAVLVPRGLA